MTKPLSPVLLSKKLVHGSCVGREQRRQRQHEQGIHGFQAGSVCLQPPLCAPFWTVSGAGAPELMEGPAHLPAVHTRVKGNGSSDQWQQQMWRSTAFLSTSVDLCLGSFVPEAAPHMP